MKTLITALGLAFYCNQFKLLDERPQKPYVVIRHEKEAGSNNSG